MTPNTWIRQPAQLFAQVGWNDRLFTPPPWSYLSRRPDFVENRQNVILSGKHSVPLIIGNNTASNNPCLSNMLCRDFYDCLRPTGDRFYKTRRASPSYRVVGWVECRINFNLYCQYVAGSKDARWLLTEIHRYPA